MNALENQLKGRLTRIEQLLTGLFSVRQLESKLAYSITETVELTGLGRTSIYEEIAAGRLPACKRGSTTIILTADLIAFLENLPPPKRSA